MSIVDNTKYVHVSVHRVGVSLDAVSIAQAMLATSKPVSRVLPKVIRTGFARMRCGCLIRQLPYLEAARNGAVRIRHAFANLVHHPYPARPHRQCEEKQIHRRRRGGRWVSFESVSESCECGTLLCDCVGQRAEIGLV